MCVYVPVCPFNPYLYVANLFLTFFSADLDNFQKLVLSTYLVSTASAAYENNFVASLDKMALVCFVDDFLKQSLGADKTTHHH